MLSVKIFRAHFFHEVASVCHMLVLKTCVSSSECSSGIVLPGQV
jgi:hypothetical protein